MKLKINFIILLSLIFLLSSCIGLGQKPEPQEEMAMPVEIITIKKTWIKDISKHIAELDSKQSVNLFPKVNSHVQKIYVQSGQKVNAGDLIIKLDSVQQSIEVKREGASKDQAIVNYNLAKAQYDRYKKLFDQELISKDALDQYYSKLKVSEEEVKKAKAEVGNKEAELGFYYVRSPIAGIVGDIAVKQGSYVDPTTLLATVSNINELEVYIEVPAEKINLLDLGSNIELFDSENKLIGKASIFFISPTVNDNLQTVLVKALYKNSDHKLRSGQKVSSQIVWEERRGFLIPVSAVKRLGSDNFVIVAEKSLDKNKKEILRAKTLPIKLGDIYNNQYEVLEGLEEDLILVIKGGEKVSDGMKLMNLEAK